MSYYGDEDWDHHRRRRSPRDYDARARAQYLNVGSGAGLHRTRSTGHAPQPFINNIYVDQMQDANLRAESPYRAPPSPRAMPVPYPASPEFRGRRLGDELVEDLAGMALRDQMRSRSRGRTEGSLADRPDFAEWRWEQKEREQEDEKRRLLWEKEAELKRLKDEAKRDKAEHDAEEAKKRVIQDYEEKKRKAAEARKQAEKDFEESQRKAAEARRQAEKEFEEKQRREAEEAKAEEKRIREKVEREKREAKEKEEREWKEFLQKQKAKEEEEKEKKKAEKEKIEAEMRRRLGRLGYTQDQIDIMVDEEAAKKFKLERGHSPRPAPAPTSNLTVFRDRAPVYAKVHRDYLSVDTLIYYDIPYEVDRVSLLLFPSPVFAPCTITNHMYQQTDPDFIIILREMDQYETEVLFEHTKRLRSGKLLLEAPKDDKKSYAWYRKRDRSTSRARKVGILEYRKVM